MAGEPELTLDLGLRYDLYPPATPREAGGFVNYNPANNQLVMAGVSGNPSNLSMQTDYRNFAPRLGVAYRATSSLVLRAGFGISYVPFVNNSYARITPSHRPTVLP
jgi:outer membrane receptor protein involved in Fe transport